MHSSMYQIYKQYLLTLGLPKVNELSVCQNVSNVTNNLFVTSKNTTTSYPIYQFTNLKSCKMSIK